MSRDDNSQHYKITDKAVEKIYVELGKRIRLARKQRGVSQEQLAIMSDIDRSHVGFIEQGRRKPTVATLHKITHSLKMSLEDLFKGL